MDAFDWKELERMYGADFHQRVVSHINGKVKTGRIVRVIPSTERLSLEDARLCYSGLKRLEGARQAKVDRIVVQHDDGHYLIGPMSMLERHGRWSSHCWIEVLPITVANRDSSQEHQR